MRHPVKRTNRMKRIRQQTAHLEMGPLQTLFGRFLPLPDDFGVSERKRLYTPARVFWIFLAQVLSADGACTNAVLGFLAWLKQATGQEGSPGTGAYCCARQLLPLGQIKALHASLADALDRDEPLFWGKRVRVVDGSTLSMPDTPENQKAWPQHSGQKPGCGFPIMRILAVFSLSTGVWHNVLVSSLNTGERTLFRSIWDQLTPDTIVLCDTGFCGYTEFVLLKRRGVDCVMHNHQRRKTGLRELTRFGRHDRLVAWFKGANRPDWITRQAWNELPETFLVREITVMVEVPGFRSKTVILATTLLDPKRYSAEEIAELYRHRWAVELFLRDIKIAMGMDVLRCKTPGMVEKELWMHVIAYNLVRGIMREAALKHGAPLERISFKGTCDAIRNWAPVLAMASPRKQASLSRALFRSIARNLVPYRPNRAQPRAKKRRPKNYQLLTQPRHLFKECPHRNKYKAIRLN